MLFEWRSELGLSLMSLIVVVASWLSGSELVAPSVMLLLIVGLASIFLFLFKGCDLALVVPLLSYPEACPWRGSILSLSWGCLKVKLIRQLVWG